MILKQDCDSGSKFGYPGQGIHISAESLFGFPERAEAEARRVNQGKGVPNLELRKGGKRHTLPEQLDIDREGSFADRTREQ